MSERPLPPSDVQREIGRYSAGLPGPLLIVTAAIHGNEPGGIHALRRVLAKLWELKPALRGELVGLAGARSAMERGLRFVDEDLNRTWSEARIAELRRRDPDQDNTEQRDQRELLGVMEGLLEGRRGRAALLDLHSVSGDGPPFSIMGDTLQNRDMAFALGVPVLLGLEENIDGTLIEYFGSKGHSAVVLEGGQNNAPPTIDNHESAVWLALVSVGLLARADVADYDFHRERLRRACEGVPHVIEVLHRHEISSEQESCFRMIPGLKSFQPIEAGRLLAHCGDDAAQQVLAPFAGLLLMPRYQDKGRDGFFLGREIEPVWLRLSATMRRLRLERMVSLLPGVRMENGSADTLAVDPRIARFFTTEFFHLLGYRKQVARDRVLIFSRRNERY